MSNPRPNSEAPPPGLASQFTRQLERRDWWLWSSAILVTLLLTAGIASFLLVFEHVPSDRTSSLTSILAVRGLVGAVLLFDLYTVYQQLQIHRTRRELAHRNELFRLISENAADMIALVDINGRRLYNSPAYEKVLGYSAAELENSSSLEQIHPDDRRRVLEAAEQARRTGVGRTVEYRMRHKDGTWRFLESTASVILDARGKPEKLVIVNRDITARKRAEERLAYSSFHDSLTNLPNRALLLDRVQQAFSHAKRHPDRKFAVLFIDIDDFKRINDSLGPAVGDQVLVQIAERLTRSLRRDDTVSRLAADKEEDGTLARLGGDEFALLLEDIKDPSDGIRVAERVQQALATPFSVNGLEIFASACIGIALSTAAYEAAEGLLRDADTALHRAKTLGVGRYELFDTQMHAGAVKRLKLESDFRKAIESRQLRNYYQPIVALPSREIRAFETLARWQHPSDGLLSPDKFITLADDTGLIVPMNQWLLRDACQRVRLWNDRYPRESPVAIAANVTFRQIEHSNLVRSIESILQESQLDPSLLEIEITETLAMQHAEKAGSVLSDLKALGVRLSIDDFGTGYSSLSRLQRLPVDTLKIDRSFITRLHTDVSSREVVRIIIMLAKHFGLEVVAEGVEAEEQAQYLQELGCDLAQGYLFSRPVEEERAEELMITSRPQVPTLG
jgi:diguanylate cyclase (GGDEF)-like protein/PAS domain S-box-containing protein